MKNLFLAAALSAFIVFIGSGCGKNPKMSPGEYLAAADSLTREGRYVEAIQSLDDMDKWYPRDTATIIKVGVLRADVYAVHLNDYSKAIASLQKIVDAYPDDPLAATCLFKIGFTYETEMKDIVKAKQAYEAFLKKYPDHELASSVRLSMDHLGESDEELLERILKKSESGAAKGK